MRVVAGTAGGIPLLAPKTDLRPTMDRVKGAIFSSLGESILGARVLDLFAGCGSLGIEALSRGCATATFVEKDRAAIEAIRRNLEKTGLSGTLHQLDVFSFLDRSAAPGSFDLVLADPPYAKQKGDRQFTAELMHSASLAAALEEGGLFVLEKMPEEKLPDVPLWECVRARRYGATEVVFLRRKTPVGLSTDR